MCPRAPKNSRHSQNFNLKSALHTLVCLLGLIDQEVGGSGRRLAPDQKVGSSNLFGLAFYSAGEMISASVASTNNNDDTPSQDRAGDLQHVRLTS